MNLMMSLPRKTVQVAIVTVVVLSTGCRSATLPGIYSGRFSWNDGLTQADLVLESDRHRNLDLRDKGLREQIEVLVLGQLQKANLRAAEGTIAVSVVGTSPLLISLQHFEILTPRFSDLLGYVDAGDVKQIEGFVKIHNDANQRDLPSQRTALFYAAAGCKIVGLQALLSLQSDPNLGDFEGDTPLMAATAAKCIEGSRQLIIAGAKVDQANHNGQTPIVRAVELGYLENLKLLLEHGANPNYILPDGRSVLTLARAKHEHVAASLLVRSGALK